MGLFSRVTHFFERSGRQIRRNPVGFALTGAPLSRKYSQRVESAELAFGTLGLSAPVWTPGETWAQNVHGKEHFAKRSLYYTVKEGPYVTAAAAAVASYFSAGLGGYVIAVLGYVLERYGGQLSAREQGMTEAQSRKYGRRYAKRTLDYSLVGAGVGGAAGLIAPASATVEAGASVATTGAEVGPLPGAVPGASAASSEAEAAVTVAPVEGSLSVGGNALPGLALNTDLGVPAAAPVHEVFSVSGDVLSPSELAHFDASALVQQSLNASINPPQSFLSTIFKPLGSLWDWVSSNPLTAGATLAGTGLSTAASLGYLGKTGQNIQTDLGSFGGLLNSLGGGGGGGGGSGPGVPDSGGGTIDPLTGLPTQSFLGQYWPYLAAAAVALLILFLLVG
jgi:hypothetical protein